MCIRDRDNASLRRGSDTVHKKWNKNIAILSGDTLLVKSYMMLLNLDSKIQNQVIKKFSETAVVVCEGQQMDMDFEKQSHLNIDDYINMIEKKTSVLFATSFEIGSIIGGASKSDQNLLYQFGLNLGIAFQLQDDLLDLYADQSKFGKSDVYSTMMDHIKGMSRDIAIMRVLGPNPDATMTWLNGMVKKQSALDSRAEAQGTFKRKKIKGDVWSNEADRTSGILDNMQNMYAYHKGNLHNPVNGFWGRTFASLRQVLTAAQLGGASIMAISDFNWSRITSRFNGLPAFKANKESLKLLKNTNGQ